VKGGGVSNVSAYDPSSWGEVSGGAENPEVTAAIEAGKLAEIGARTVEGWIAEHDRADYEILTAELADLRDLRESARAQQVKAEATAEAAKVELGRLIARIEVVEREIDAMTIDDTDAPEIEG